jgi:hypothetical protein
VTPRRLSNNTLVVLPVMKTERGVFVGIEQRDLPAVQSFAGSSGIAAAPAWRLPLTVKHQSDIRPFLATALNRDFHLRAGRSWELGGPYFSTPGVTPEIVYPYVVEAELGAEFDPLLQFTYIGDLADKLDSFHEAHLLIAVCRLIHALGLLP